MRFDSYIEIKGSSVLLLCHLILWL